MSLCFGEFNFLYFVLNFKLIVQSLMNIMGGPAHDTAWTVGRWFSGSELAGRGEYKVANAFDYIPR